MLWLGWGGVRRVGETEWGGLGRRGLEVRGRRERESQWVVLVREKVVGDEEPNAGARRRADERNRQPEALARQRAGAAQFHPGALFAHLCFLALIGWTFRGGTCGEQVWGRWGGSLAGTRARRLG